jgi:hypothetical protein
MKQHSFFRSAVTFVRGFIFAVAIFAAVITPVYAQTQAWTGVCVGPVKLNPNTTATDVATLQGVQCLLANIFTIILTVIGLAGFVMFIVGSFRYLLSGGNSKGTETAKNTFTFMVVGIIVALSGFIVLRLLASFTGIDILTKIVIPSSNRGLQGDTYPGGSGSP